MRATEKVEGHLFEMLFCYLSKENKASVARE